MTAKHALDVLPGVGVSLLPKLACPMCAPAYAGLLTALGLGFFIPERNLLLLTAAFLVLSVAALAFRARRRRGYGPALMGIVSAAVVFIGKFYLQSTAAMFAGLSLLIAASIWNNWPRRTAPTPCPKCAPSDAELIQLSAMEKLS
jgi:mercuric ion transport protein